MVWFVGPCVIAALASIIVSFQCKRSRAFRVKNNKNNKSASWLLDDDKSFHTFTDEQQQRRRRKLTVERLSIHPPIFRVSNFLTAHECETLRRLATQKGLHDGYVDSDDGLQYSNNNKNNNNNKKKMGIFDHDNDGRLNVYELIRMIDDFFESHVSEEDVLDMMTSMNMKLDNDSTNNNTNNPSIAIDDFIQSVDTGAMRRYFLNLLQENPSKKSRHSNMAWLNDDNDSSGTHYTKGDSNTMAAIRHRVASLTNIPQKTSMELQVVHYPQQSNDNNTSGGHYTAHFDSLPISEQPCCHTINRQPPCRACRLATVLYSLSDEEQGGHTAFPFATNNSNDTTTTSDSTPESIENWRMSSASRESSYCGGANDDAPGLRIAPQLGQAILWYNHELLMDDDTPILGELNRLSLHAGCPTTKSTTKSTTKEPWNAPGKWIANHWIELSNIPGQE